jgi:hypothetical protein
MDGVCTLGWQCTGNRSASFAIQGRNLWIIFPGDDKNPTTRCTCIDDIGRGRVHHPQRISFMERHIAHAARAIQAGIPLHGYFAWSLMDNFEWAEGYSKRFGLVYIDYPTQERILKDSALWYRDWIASL